MIAVKQGLAESVYYTGFIHTAASGRSLRGTVTDADTGEPIAGVRVKTYGSWESLRNPSVTDAEGRYEISRVSKAEAYRLACETTRSLHFNREVQLTDTPGLEPIVTNVALRRGITVRGRVTDAESGAPLRGSVIYNPLFPNEHVLELGESLSIAKPAARGLIDEDGSFEISVLPGPGAIAIQASADGYVSAAVGADRLRAIVGDRQIRPNEYGEVRFLQTAAGEQAQSAMALTNYAAVALVNFPHDTQEQTIDFCAVPARSRPGTIEDESGKPLVGVKVIGLGPNQASATSEPLESAEFTVEGLAPGRKRTLLFVHDQRQLGARVVVTGDDTAPLTVRMTPTGTITGRFIDQRGEPLSGVVVQLTPHEPPLGGTDYWHGESDHEGRFQVTGLIAGAAFRVYARPIQQQGPDLYVRSNVRVAAAKTLELGTYTQENDHLYRRVDESDP